MCRSWATLSSMPATLTLVRGSVTDQAVDAIVNAANTRMRGGGGIDGRIHQLAGPRMLEELRRVAGQGAEVGEAVVTRGYDLPQPIVIHVAGPIWRGGHEGEAEALAGAYRNALLAAESERCVSVAFCSISTGAFGYPLALAAPLAVATLTDTGANLVHVERIVLAMFGREEYDAFHAGLCFGA